MSWNSEVYCMHLIHTHAHARTHTHLCSHARTHTHTHTRPELHPKAVSSCVVCSASSDSGATMDKWLSKLESSAWLTHIKDILTTACVVAQCMDKEGKMSAYPCACACACVCVCVCVCACVHRARERVRVKKINPFQLDRVTD